MCMHIYHSNRLKSNSETKLGLGRGGGGIVNWDHITGIDMR